MCTKLTQPKEWKRKCRTRDLSRCVSGIKWDRSLVLGEKWTRSIGGRRKNHCFGGEFNGLRVLSLSQPIGHERFVLNVDECTHLCGRSHLVSVSLHHSHSTKNFLLSLSLSLPLFFALTRSQQALRSRSRVFPRWCRNKYLKIVSG